MEGEPPPVEERRRLQEELTGFVESCCRTLEELTSSLGWSLDRLEPEEEAAAEVRGAGAWGLGACGSPWRPHPRRATGGRAWEPRPGQSRGGLRDSFGAAPLLALRA